MDQQCGSKVLLTKKFNFPAENNSYIFYIKSCNLFIPSLPWRTSSYRRSLHLSNENIQHFLDPDPGDQTNGVTSTDTGYNAYVFFGVANLLFEVLHRRSTERNSLTIYSLCSAGRILPNVTDRRVGTVSTDPTEGPWALVPNNKWNRESKSDDLIWIPWQTLYGRT